jgi:hypothetical protein
VAAGPEFECSRYPAEAGLPCQRVGFASPLDTAASVSG